MAPYKYNYVTWLLHCSFNTDALSKSSSTLFPPFLDGEHPAVEKQPEMSDCLFYIDPRPNPWLHAVGGFPGSHMVAIGDLRSLDWMF